MPWLKAEDRVTERFPGEMGPIDAFDTERYAHALRKLLNGLDGEIVIAALSSHAAGRPGTKDGRGVQKFLRGRIRTGLAELSDRDRALSLLHDYATGREAGPDQVSGAEPAGLDDLRRARELGVNLLNPGVSGAGPDTSVFTATTGGITVRLTSDGIELSGLDATGEHRTFVIPKEIAFMVRGLIRSADLADP